MTKLQELVEAEAQRAEAEPEPDEPEPEPEPGEPEPEPEPEPDEQTDAPSAQKQVRDLERAFARHTKAVAKALGVEPDTLEACPTCDGTGVSMAGAEPAPALVPDPSLEVCDACAGWGQRGTPSRDPSKALVVCTVCAGYGYHTRPAPEQPVQPYLPQPAAGAPVDAFEAEAARRGLLLVPTGNSGSGYAPPSPSEPAATVGA